MPFLETSKVRSDRSPGREVAVCTGAWKIQQLDC